MMQKRETRTLKIVILVFGVISLVYGFFFMVVPGWYLNMIGESPVPLVNIRWSGGVLIALAYGAWKFYKDPTKGKAYAYTIAVAPLLGGSSLLYSLITGEYTGRGVFHAFPGVLGIAISLLVIWNLIKIKSWD
ncbi:hypothetical protein ACFLVN_01135 [Chloroflexota bacterium]